MRAVRSIAVQAAELDTYGKGTQEEDRLKPRQLLLFNDMLMLAKDKGDEKLSYKAHIDFDDQVRFRLHVAFLPRVASRYSVAQLHLSTLVLHSKLRY